MQDMEEIYKEHSQTVYKYIFCLSNGDKDLAEEITSETFAIAVERINQFKGECKISVWLCQIAKYIWYKEVKKKSRIKFEELETLQDEQIIEDIIVEKEAKLQIFKDIQTLDEKTKDVMYLRLIGDLSFKEIGEVLGKTSNWARVTYYRGKQKIKEEENNARKRKM
ncbi:MAG: sigma-70 family RNA polymerase sigma factor [Clostridia bacterium]|nr:sigma-70 family RNA polymerase sigma factor [Clostridia bacterium]